MPQSQRSTPLFRDVAVLVEGQPPAGSKPFLLMADAIALSELAFSYRSADAQAVFHDVNLRVPVGARVVLVGANGAGKSTLLRVISGRRKASRGRATVLGNDAFEHTPLALRVNLVTADWDEELTLPVRQLVGTAVAASGADAARVSTLLATLGIVPLLHAELSQLSDGQRRRVQLFCKLLPPRELVLLDEATNSLDVLSRASLLAFLRHESEVRACTVVFCTHIFDGLDGWATQLAHLDGGLLRRHVSSADLPQDSSLYQVVSAWLQDHANEMAGGVVAGTSSTFAPPTADEVARALMDVHYPSATLRSSSDTERAAHASAIEHANASILDLVQRGTRAHQGSGGWAALPKRTRPESPEGQQAPRPDSVASEPIKLPDGWQERSVSVADGAFGSHAWSSLQSSGVVESAVPSGSSGARLDDTPRATVAAPAAAITSPLPTPPHEPLPPAPTASCGTVADERLAGSGGSEAHEARSPSLPTRTELPEAAARIAPVLQAALDALNSRVSACSSAVGAGDLAATSTEAAAIKMLWSQAEKALQVFETAMQASAKEPPLGGGGGGSGGGGGGELAAFAAFPNSTAPVVATSGSGSAPVAMAASGALAGSTSDVPIGWGSRHTAMSEEELVRKGIIPPPTTFQ